MFAVIGAGNECYYNDNYFSNVASALNLALESFGLEANMTSNVTSGPSNLAVQFESLCTPGTGIESWEWDLNGDGEIDSTEEDPYFLYTEQGSYDVTLTITMEGEISTLTNEDYITVTDGSNISGPLSGIWLPDYTYTITDDANIAVEDQLVISEGTIINIENDVQLLVNGLLAADASSSQGEPIIFTSESSWSGIRFFNTQEDNILANCEISKANIAAVKIEGDSKVDVIGCKIFDNTSTSQGAAFEVVGSDNVLINKNIIANNISTNAIGGIKCTDSSIEISNNIIANNSGSYGAVILMNNSDVNFVNNTIANNEATGVNAYPFFILSSDPIIKNCIIIDSNPIFFASGAVNVTYTCISGGFTGEGNIDADPLFVEATEGDGAGYDGLAADWSLLAGSLCIDAGDPDAIYNDIDDSRNDMGAYGGPTPYELEPASSSDNIVNVTAVNSISVYPNPFNPTTNIALSINENDIQQPLSVEIFNIKGQLVKTIVSNEIVQTTNFVWNGKDNNNNSTASGMYFVKMKTATSETSKKMLLLK